MGNPFVRSGLSFSFPTSILPPLKPLHETLLTRIPIGFPKHRRTLPPHSSPSSSNFDIISTTESWDGSLLFRFGDESEKSVTTETETDAQSHLEDPVHDSELSQTLLGRRGSGGGGGAAAEADETVVDAVSVTSTDNATGGGGEETTTTRSITTITTTTTDDETQLSNEIHAFPAIGTAAAEAKENAVDVVSVTSTGSETGRGDGSEKPTITTTTTTTTTADGTEISSEIPAFPSIVGAKAEENAVDAVSLTRTGIATGGGSGVGEETTTRTNETQVNKEIHAFPAIGTAAAEAKENVIDAVSVTSTNNVTGGGGSGGGEETTTTTTTITDESQVSNEIHAFPAIGGAKAEENAVDAVSVMSTGIVTGGGSGGGEETTTTTTRTTTTVETQVSNDIHAEGEENAADAVSMTSAGISTGGEETTTTTTTEETQVSNEIHAFPAISGAEAKENAVDAVLVTSTDIATGGGSGGGKETTTTTTTTIKTDETQVSNDIHAEAEENAVDAVSVTSTGIAKGGGSGSGEETTTTTTTTTEETQVSSEIHAFPAIGGAEENAVDVVSVMSTSTVTGGGSGGGEETTTTTTTRTTTDETQVSNEIHAFPAISGAEAEENAVDAVSVASTNIATGGSSSGGQESTTTTTTDETQVSNDIHAQDEEKAVDAVSVTSTNNATGGAGGEETTTTITTKATTTTAADETQVSPVLAENAPSTNPEDEFTEGKADTTDVSGISTSRIVEFNTVEGVFDGENVSAAVLQLSSSAALLPHPSKVGRMLTLLLAKIG